MMRLLHRCDLFRVVQDRENHLTPATAYGAAVSLVTTLLLAVLLFGEFYSYFSGHKNCHITPSVFKNTLDAEAQRKVDTLHFSISLPFIPCDRVATETLSPWGHDVEVERETLVWLSHIPHGSYTGESSVAYIVGEVLDGDERGCLVTGTAPIAVVSSSFNIVLRNYRLEDSRRLRPDFKIHYFSAGNAYEDWGVPQIRRQTLEPMSGFQSSFNLQQPYFYQFFLQLIQTTVDLPGREDRFGYQYTAFYSMLRYNGQGRPPGLYFAYKPSPFSMDCAVQHDTISHFIINLCAVVGGVYTVAGMVEAGLEWLARERRLRETAASHRRNAEALLSASRDHPATA
ncbi:Endoplasmic reticulum vesicle transporter [Novymonas esmeraldas]|uniref:Endoplasmic reticulum vesicle transporter n=1 Tax=Novymonas esmeraldas TaxID=1808958 RepID=A0AAW0EXM3_9TRYP